MSRFILILLIVVASVPHSAVAQPNNYVTAVASVIQFEGYEPGFGVGLGLAKSLHRYIPFFALEGSIVKSFRTMSPKNNELSIKRSFTKYATAAVILYPLDMRFALKVKMLGIHYIDMVERSDTGKHYPSQTNIEFGAGVLIKLDQKKEFLVEIVTNNTNELYYLNIGYQINY